MGRFINADAFASTGQGLLGNNMFAYCNNNPVNYADPSGLVPGNVIFPICLGGTGTHGLIGKTDGKQNSEGLLQYIIDTNMAPSDATVYVDVEYVGAYTKYTDPTSDIIMGGLGVAALVAPYFVPGLREYKAAVDFIGGASTLYSFGSMCVNLLDELPDRDYHSYKVTMTWTSVAQPTGYPNVLITTDHYAEMYYLWNDTSLTEPSWYLLSDSWDITTNTYVLP